MAGIHKVYFHVSGFLYTLDEFVKFLLNESID